MSETLLSPGGCTAMRVTPVLQSHFACSVHSIYITRPALKSVPAPAKPLGEILLKPQPWDWTSPGSEEFDMRLTPSLQHLGAAFLTFWYSCTQLLGFPATV